MACLHDRRTCVWSAQGSLHRVRATLITPSMLLYYCLMKLQFQGHNTAGLFSVRISSAAFDFRLCKKLWGTHRNSPCFLHFLFRISLHGSKPFSFKRASPLYPYFIKTSFSLLWRSSIAAKQHDFTMEYMYIFVNISTVICDSQYVIKYYMTNYSYIYIIFIAQIYHYIFYYYFISL